MRDRDVVSWNALICGYSRNGYDFGALELFVQMLREGFIPSHTTMVSLVPSCGRRELAFQGKSIHGFGVKAGLDLDSQAKNALTSMYAKCVDLEAAELLFGEMVKRSAVSWNTMIGAYGQNGYFDEAMLVFNRMREEGMEANSVTIISLLSANAHPESIHSYALKTGVVNDASVITALVCVYARYVNTELAKLLYESFPQNNLVSLTAIISSYAEKGNMAMVVECFSQMQQLNLKLDAVAMVSILHGIKHPAHFGSGLAFHGYGLKIGLSVDCLVANGLISMYSNFDEIESAFSLFFGMHEKPLISWNSVISGCVQAGRSSDAMELFCQMKMFGHSPDAITITSLLSGCCQLGYLQFGNKLHNYVLRNNLEVEDFVGTALIDMYTKCGRIECAERVFKSIKEPCLATWNAIISGYSLYGLEHKALGCFSQMRVQGLKPDKITFLGVLAACTHGGLVQEGRRYFQIMREEFGMVPGLFEEAMDFIKNMEIEPDSAVWGALLSACCIHQEVRLGESLAKKLFFLDCNNGGFYVLMSNLYAVKGRWDDVARLREMMRDAGGDGCSGVSIIEDCVFENTYGVEAIEENKVKVYGKDFIGWLKPEIADDSVWEDTEDSFSKSPGSETQVRASQDLREEFEEAANGGLHQFDIETGKIVTEWKFGKDGTDITMRDVTNDSKGAQLDPSGSTFLGLDDNRLCRWDMRDRNGMVQNLANASTPVLNWTQGHQFSRGTNFQCFATTGDGSIVVGSLDGKIRLYSTNSMRQAKTAFPGLGSPITHVDVTFDGKWILGTTDTYLILVCTMFTDKDGNTKTGFTGRMGNRISAPRLLKLNPLDSHLAGVDNKFRNAQFSWVTENGKQERHLVATVGKFSVIWNFQQVKNGSHECYRHQEGLKSCYCYKIVLKDDSIVASRFMHEKYAVTDSPEAPLVIATPMKVSSFSISSRR
ncbi:hypothetical protein FH972_018550 [Carpinus fangiana]|uniref:Vacuolar import/degradation Vid27 C-terminal domain-containing protein n=1 Tax=Carpinus fangiana TaxID=176857 RepID=A0A5N6RQW1_9ROSI|nr:hypothetical protein FH972_018550 [Carpinus fangiana]